MKVVVANALPAAGLDMLRARFDVELGDLGRNAPGAVALVTDPGVPVDARLLDAAGASLKVVANFAVGYDNFDLDALRARDVRATNTPGVLTTATAELAVTLMLAAGRRVAEGDAFVRRGDWHGLGPEEMLGHGLAGATVGLIGFGRIARRVAELLAGFGVRLLHTGRGESADALLAESDFVSVHVPLAPETRHLVDALALARMKRSAILVNTSRGGVVDTAALVEALREGRIAAAGLDVYEDEPDVPAELRELPNTVLLPHVGSATRAARDAMARMCAENVIAVVDGREPPAAVV